MVNVNNKIPFRANIAIQLMQHEEGLSAQQLCEILKSEFGREKQCSAKEIDDQLMSFRGVGITEVIKTALNDKDEIVTTYRMTPYGSQRVHKYLAKFL